MRTTVRIDDALLERAKRRAAAQGATLGSYMEEALRQHLSSLPTPHQDVDLPVFDGGADGGLHPGIDPASNRALYEALDERRDTAA